MSGGKLMARKDVLKGRSIVRKNIFDTVNQSIDEIKRANPIVSYFESKGVKLTKSGDEYKGLCPFHNDHNPSLSVNDTRQVFKCFGCGKAGTVIDACSFFENISIGEAVKLLGNNKHKTTGNLFPSLNRQQRSQKENHPESDLKFEIPDKLDYLVNGISNATDQADMDPPAVNLNDIVDEYHRNLLKNENAIHYLNQRGIKETSIITDYKIGYCDSTLSKKLSHKQIDSLKGPGIFRDNGSEVFTNCLIFPVFDETKQTVRIYGRNISQNAKVKHLYLKGNHKSVFNRPAVKVYPEQIILTECIIDALSLIQLDIKNVLACYGVNGFTDEMKDLLKKNRVKEIVIAFDNDEAGRKGAEKLKDELVNEGFAVKCIYPSEKKDWNESLQHGIRKDEIQTLIEKAKVFQAEKKEHMTFEIKGDTYYFTRDGLTYRVIGFKGNFTTELKLNFRCWQNENRDKTLSRVINIYADRAVELYIRALSEEFAISSDIIKAHFNRMIEIFEEERERILDEKGKKFDKPVYILTPSEEKRALDILTGSDVIHDHLLPDTEKIGLVGETENKIICYHAIISRLWRRPVNICTLSMYGMGKSFLHDTMHRFVPDEDLKDYSRITKNDLYYREEENAFVGKILSVDEVDGIADSLYSIRTLISKGYLSISYPSMDPVNGKMRNEENKVFGRPSVFVTGTNDERMDEETLSRFAVCTTDASNDQRLRIKQRQLYEMTKKGVAERRMEDELVKKHKNILRIVQKVEVVFPEKWELTGIENGDYSPRNHLCYLSFIASSAIRDQYNRKVYTGDDSYGKFRYVEIKKDDIILANRIMLELFGKSVRDLKPPQMHFLKEFMKLAKKEVQGKHLNIQDVSFTELEIRSQVKMSYWQVNRYLNDLVRLEYAGVVSKGINNQKKYRLLMDNLDNPEGRYLTGLLNPDEF
jgi:DNA primase